MNRRPGRRGPDDPEAQVPISLDHPGEFYRDDADDEPLCSMASRKCGACKARCCSVAWSKLKDILMLSMTFIIMAILAVFLYTGIGYNSKLHTMTDQSAAMVNSTYAKFPAWLASVDAMMLAAKDLAESRPDDFANTTFSAMSHGTQLMATMNTASKVWVPHITSLLRTANVMTPADAEQFKQHMERIMHQVAAGNTTLLMQDVHAGLVFANRFFSNLQQHGALQATLGFGGGGLLGSLLGLPQPNATSGTS